MEAWVILFYVSHFSYVTRGWQLNLAIHNLYISHCTCNLNPGLTILLLNICIFAVSTASIGWIQNTTSLNNGLSRDCTKWLWLYKACDMRHALLSSWLGVCCLSSSRNIQTLHRFTRYTFGTATRKAVLTLLRSRVSSPQVKTVITLLLNYKCEVFLYPGIETGFRKMITRG